MLNANGRIGVEPYSFEDRKCAKGKLKAECRRLKANDRKGVHPYQAEARESAAAKAKSETLKQNAERKTPNAGGRILVKNTENAETSLKLLSFSLKPQRKAAYS